MASRSSGGVSDPSISLEEIDAALRAEYGQFSPYQGVDVLLLDPKKKLQLFAATSYLENKLENASPKEVQRMVDSGLFKGLCSMMAIAPDESEEADAVMTVCTDRLTAFVEALPELSAKAWSYGAVRPITAVLLRKWDLSKVDFLSNDALKASILFLEANGQPCHEHLFGQGDVESPPSEAKKTAGKLYRWLLKKGAIDAVVRIWSALPNYGEEYEESTNYEELASSCASVLWYANLVHRKEMVMASKAELLKPILHFLLVEQSAPKQMRQVAVALLYNLWLNDTNQYFKLPDAAKVRKQIARHPDVLQLLSLLREYAEDADKEPSLTNHPLLQSSFIGLMRLLASNSSVPLPRQAFHTACHLLRTVSDPVVWGLGSNLVSNLCIEGKLSTSDLLAHAFPGLLRAFAAEVARRYPATRAISDPDMDLLIQMIDYLLRAYGRAYQKVAALRGESFGIDPSSAGGVLSLDDLPKLTRQMIQTRAAAAVAALSQSVYYVKSNTFVRMLAESVVRDRTLFKALLEQMIPALILSIAEQSAGDKHRGSQSFVLVRLLSQLDERDGSIRFETFQTAGPHQPEVGVLDRAASRVRYEYANNKVCINEALLKGTGNMLLEFLADFHVTGSLRSDAVQLPKERETAPSATGPTCYLCGKQSDALKRCGRCRVAEYCGAHCQTTDWPTHKVVCKSKGMGKKGADTVKRTGVK
ncbi:hypothetical protein KFL_004470010 [Klebsormidium nitens]|uniref:MYND-type domain-containing protein n=1 Tax=Klebsormidium nitens TaxID=105231 RepID=A0A1Y1IIV1_KLENI|nr:hypothetical protein KFL_004470010 [Klebsormidium nitens]|eukprot:GAQ88636.1 hypothetical protein KFL_004470010 [Klebsormidium nitens]